MQKDGTSLGGQKITADVVETYVPIMAGDQFIGVFEIYYDVTERKKKLAESETEKGGLTPDEG